MALVITLAQTAFAQAPKAGGAMPDEKVSTLPLTIESLGWLEGCWRGTVNQREFREYWLPLRGGMIVSTTGSGFRLREIPASARRSGCCDITSNKKS